MRRLDAPRRTGSEELFQTLVAETDNHGEDVLRIDARYKRPSLPSN